MRRTQFAAGEYYHVYNRGVEKREIFSQRTDYERFLFCLYACNDRRPLLNSQFHYRGLASIGVRAKERVPLADILCLCLMPNHYHLLLRQRGDDGITKFLQKVGTAYTMYFNTKYARSGYLFQGPYQAIRVPDDQYFLPLTRYIHLNPLELTQPHWKERGVRQPKQARRFILEYPWSSYSDYVDQPRYPSLLSTTLIRRIFRTPQEYTRYVESWRRHDLRSIEALTIEAGPR